VSSVRYYGRLARHAGYSIAKGVALPFVRHEAIRSGAHELAYPITTYAPWRSDGEFQRVNQAIRRNTLVASSASCATCPAILEVGVSRGGTGALMAARAAGLGLGETVYLCDTWTGVAKTGEVDISCRDGKHDDASQEIVERLIAGLGLSNVELLQGVFPEETGDRIPTGTFRPCHCDVDVYESAKGVLEWIWPRLAAGAVVVFDDYGFPACPGVTKLVDEQRMRDDRLVLHNLNGHGLVVKR
jgi:O-methyltransferase